MDVKILDVLAPKAHEVKRLLGRKDVIGRRAALRTKAADCTTHNKTHQTRHGKTTGGRCGGG